jgi:phosphatidylglycerophosphatase A
VLLWWAAARNLPAEWRWGAALAGCAVATAIGIPAATREARVCGREDPGQVVVDEVAGQLLTLVAVPLGWKSLLAGFILFRCFDIVKPWPVRRLERLPEGTGIVVDDLGAGVYAWVVLHVLLRSGIFS